MSIVYIGIFSINYIIFLTAAATGTNPLDFYTPKKWKSVGIWLAKKYLSYHNETNTHLTREELINYGYRFAKCYDCVIAGKCIDCKCDTVGKMNVRSEQCSLGKWGDFIDEKDLDDYLLSKASNFKIEVTEE